MNNDKNDQAGETKGMNKLRRQLMHVAWVAPTISMVSLPSHAQTSSTVAPPQGNGNPNDLNYTGTDGQEYTDTSTDTVYSYNAADEVWEEVVEVTTTAAPTTTAAATTTPAPDPFQSESFVLDNVIIVNVACNIKNGAYNGPCSAKWENAFINTGSLPITITSIVSPSGLWSHVTNPGLPITLNPSQGIRIVRELITPLVSGSDPANAPAVDGVVNFVDGSTYSPV